MNDPEYFSKADLARRWGTSPQNVNNWEIRENNFPEPAFRVAKGRMPIYHIDAIRSYEQRKGIKVHGAEEI